MACADSGASDLNVAIATGQQKEDGRWVVNLQATRGGVCDQMVLFTLGANDVTVSLGDSEQSIPLRNVRIASVVRRSTNPSGRNEHPVRFGSGAFCVWAAEKGKSWNQTYEVTVQAFDPEGNLHQGTAAVEVDCTTTSDGATSRTAFSDTSDYCEESTACVASAELPDTCHDQCQCDPDNGGSEGGGSGGGGSEGGGSEGGGSEGGGSEGGGSEGGGSEGGGSEGGGSEGGGSEGGGSGEECIPSGENDCGDASGGEGAGSGEGSSAENEALVSAGSQAIQGGCAAFPGAGLDLGVMVLTMLGASVALRRRR